MVAASPIDFDPVWNILFFDGYCENTNKERKKEKRDIIISDFYQPVLNNVTFLKFKRFINN